MTLARRRRPLGWPTTAPLKQFPSEGEEFKREREEEK
jgi:hypothetical protein